MNLLFNIFNFIILSLLIVIISKYVLVTVLRKLAEALNLKPKTVGNIAGVATSVPELLTVSFSAIAGFIGASSYNILSSNIINLIQYLFAIFLNKNQSQLKNRALKIDLIIVIVTIVIPILLLFSNIEYNLAIVPALILLMTLSYFINSNAHKLYLKSEDLELNKKIMKEARWVKGKRKVIIKYIIVLIFSAIALYVIGNLLSNNLTRLCEKFMIPEFILGITLGFVTSIPELITFFESQKHYKNSNGKLGVIEATNNLLTSNVFNLFIIQTIGIILFSIFN